MHMHTKGTIKLKKLKESSSTVKRLKAKTVILSLVKCASYMIKLLLILICCVLGRHTLLNTEVSGIL